MSNKILLIAIICSCPSIILCNVGPPVFLFKDARVKSSIEKPLAGHTIPKNEFTTSMTGIENSDIMITFMQDELSNEDFLRLDQNMKRGGLFKNVQRYSEMKTSMYFPSVKAPMEGLTRLMQTFDEEVELKDPLQVVKYLTNTKPQKASSILIHLLPTAGEGTSAALRKNDELIGEVLSLIEQSGLGYIAFFTANNHRNAHEAAVVQGVGRHLLQTNDVQNGTFFYNDTNCLLYIDNMTLYGEPVLDRPDFSCDNQTVGNGTQLWNIVMNIGDKEIEMIFMKDLFGGWFLNSTTIDGESVSSPAIAAPLQFSYHCSTTLNFSSSDNSSSVPLSIKTIQVQVIDFKDSNMFGLPYDCVGFFTIPLWTGLLTALFLIAVTVYGIYMLSSVQTFDQYDDPKGKPLTVTVSE